MNTVPFPWARVAMIAAGFAAVEQLIVVPVFAGLFGLTPMAAPLATRWGWATVSACIVVGALAFVAGRVRATLEQLFVAFFIILAGLKFAAQAQSAYFFEPDVSAVRFTGVILQIVCGSIVLAAAAAFLLHRDAAAEEVRGPTRFELSDLGWLWRVPAVGGLYFVLFMAAGLIIWPFVQDFYAEHQQRLGLLLFEWEYLNGVWFALIALPLLRLVQGDWLRAGITIGVALCLIRGIGGLIVPSPNLPMPIRLWHMFEVGWSNFVYGLAIAYVFLPRPRRAET